MTRSELSPDEPAGLRWRTAPTPSAHQHREPGSYADVVAWLQESTRLPASALSSAKKNSDATGEPLPLLLNRIGACSDTDLQAAFSAITGAPLATSPPDPNTRGVRFQFLRTHRALILKSPPDVTYLGLVDPLDEEAVRGVAFATERPVEVFVVAASEQRRQFHALFEGSRPESEEPRTDQADERLAAALEFDRDAPVARRVASWLAVAAERGASDVHFEPRDQTMAVRYRVDGLLETVAEEPVSTASAVIARIKVLADLDLGERRTPQDGRTTIIVTGRPVDVRVSIVPSVHGESAVLRLLDRGGLALDLPTLGYAPEEAKVLQQTLSQPNGLFIISGPTGSGKTTTLYAMIAALRESSRKILTIEDPVEYYFEHVTQVQYSPKVGITFPAAIRSFLRQDPDVIMIGEIRDADTAATAIQAALTGHLVLATLHAIDAPKAIPRLLDMGVEPALLSACLRAVISQRLVRRLCLHCRRRRLPTPHEVGILGLTGEDWVFEAAGCSHCRGSGFVGRIALVEALEANGSVLDRISRGLDLDQAIQRRLIHDGLRKVSEGLTSPEEVLRALAG